MSQNLTPTERYTFHILQQLKEMLSDEECSNFIALKELSEGDNLESFIHALTCASTMLCNKLTGNDYNQLEFNHVANQLCFQFMERPEK